MQRMDEQQGSTVHYREVYSISLKNQNGKEHEKEHICVCVYV